MQFFEVFLRLAPSIFITDPLVISDILSTVFSAIPLLKSQINL